MQDASPGQYVYREGVSGMSIASPLLFNIMIEMLEFV